MKLIPARGRPADPRQEAKILWLLLLCLLPIMWSVADCFRMDADGQALREALTRNSGASFARQFQAAVGPVLLGAARFGLGFVEELPLEARRAMTALRAARFSLDRVEGQIEGPELACMLGEADRVMERRGWQRMVGVLESDTLVAVYVGRRVGWGGTVRTRVAVLDSGQLVIVSAKARVQPLIELGLEAMERELGRAPARIGT